MKQNANRERNTLRPDWFFFYIISIKTYSFLYILVFKIVNTADDLQLQNCFGVFNWTWNETVLITRILTMTR